MRKNRGRGSNPQGNSRHPSRNSARRNVSSAETSNIYLIAGPINGGGNRTGDGHENTFTVNRDSSPERPSSTGIANREGFTSNTSSLLAVQKDTSPGTSKGRPTKSRGQGRSGAGSSRNLNANRQHRQGVSRYSRHAYVPSRIWSNPPSTAVSKYANDSPTGPGVNTDRKGTNLDKTVSRNLEVNPVRHYTVKPVIPAKNAELLSVARAMNRDEFAPRLKKLFDPEREAALEAIESGFYVGWRCPEYKHDCIRVGSKSRCFCGHPLLSHGGKATTSNYVCKVDNCACKSFAFIPSRPEEVGEWWLPKRPGFDVRKWRAKCRCKHTHEEHNPCGRRQCSVNRCTCFAFDSNFLCCACDRHWEEHQTFFDTADSRKRQGLPYGEEYLPFHEMPDLRNIVLTGDDTDNTQYDAITSGPHAIPRFEPSPLAMKLARRPQR